MVRLQALTGMRSENLCLLRPCDVNRTADPWEYRPIGHKTGHLGRELLVLFGPQAQRELLPYMDRDPAAYCFRPAEATAQHRDRRRTARRSKPTPSELAMRAAPKRLHHAAHYTPGTYRQAVVRGIEAARRAGFHVIHWHPHMLRHTVATAIRERYGVEAAQVYLGHARADVTQIYAERDFGLATRIAREMG